MRIEVSSEGDDGYLDLAHRLVSQTVKVRVVCQCRLRSEVVHLFIRLGLECQMRRGFMQPIKTGRQA